MAVAPVLKTSICKSNVSTSSKLRFYVQRKLNVRGDANLTRLSQYNMFKSLCDQELNYQELMSDLSISCFCRTGVVDTSVILESDCDCHTFEGHLQDMTLTTDAVAFLGKYLSTLHAKTAVCSPSVNENIQKTIASKFCGGTQRETIVKSVFEEPLRKAHTVISPHMKRFDEKDFLKKMDKLSEKFQGLNQAVAHGNFTANNVVLKDSTTCGKIVAFGSELSHLGNPIYDVGTFVGDLLVWYYLHKLHPDATVQREVFSQTICECIVEFLSTYIDKFIFFVDDDAILTNIMSLAAGYAGIAMLFRVVGGNWSELAIENCKVRQAILGCVCRLIDGFEKVETCTQLINVALTPC